MNQRVVSVGNRGFAPVSIIFFLVAIITVGVGSYFYISHQPIQPIKDSEEKTNEIVNKPQDILIDIPPTKETVERQEPPVSNTKNFPKISPKKSESIVREVQTPIPDKPRTTTSSDVVEGYPVNCYPRLGFDNNRTEQSFVINPKDNKTMYINVEYMGIYKSIDGGNSWVFSGRGLKGLPRNDDPSKPCHDLRFHLYIDPLNPDRLLAPGGSAPGRVGEGLGGLSESLDGGASWHQLFTSDMSAYTESTVIDPVNSNIVYVTTSALPQSMDGPDRGKTFVTKGVVYKTADGGKTWEELHTGLFKDLRVPGIFIDAQNPGKLRLATFGLPSGTNIDKKITEEQWGFLETNDFGHTWTKFASTIGIGIRYLDVSPKNLNHFYLMASKDNIDKVFYSVDGTLNEPGNTTVNFARYDPHDENGMHLIGINIFAQPNDIFESTDGGKTWNTVGKLPLGITNEHRASNIVFDPVDKNVIYINADQARVWRSRDKGNTWESLLNTDKLKDL